MDETPRRFEISKADIVDAHTHVGAARVAIGDANKDAESKLGLERDLAERLAILDERGVGKAVVIPGHNYLRPEGIVDTRDVNNQIASYRDGCSNRILAAIGIVEPLYGARGFEEILRCKEELNLVGISFHSRFQGGSIDDIWVFRYIERMGELGLVPYVHAVGESVDESLWKIENLAKGLPDVRFLVLDAFSTAEQSHFLLSAAERQTNLLFETSLSLSFSKRVLPAINRIGASRIVYGSDLYSWPYGAPSGEVLQDVKDSDLSGEDKVAILGGNVLRLLGLGAEGN